MYIDYYPNNGELLAYTEDATSDSIEVASIDKVTSNLYENYYFSSWNTADDGTGDTYYPGNIVTTDLTLYAIWKSSILSNTSWLINEVIDLVYDIIVYKNDKDANDLLTTPMFKSNNIDWYGLIINSTSLTFLRQDFSTEVAYTNGTWTNNQYKLLSFLNEPDTFSNNSNTNLSKQTDFMNWLNGNGQTITLTNTSWVIKDKITFPNSTISCEGNIVAASPISKVCNYLIITNTNIQYKWWSQSEYDYEIDIVYTTTSINSPPGITFATEPNTYSPDKATFLNWLYANAIQITQDYTTDNSSLTRIANAIREKTGQNSLLTFPNEFVTAINNIPVLDTSDATATEGKIKSGFTAYVNGNKITGTYIPRLNNIETCTGELNITPSQTITFRSTKMSQAYHLVSHPITKIYDLFFVLRVTSGTIDDEPMDQDIIDRIIIKLTWNDSRNCADAYIQLTSGYLNIQQNSTLHLEFIYYDYSIT